jgi:tetratricopeptide (TPR) repeat protein
MQRLLALVFLGCLVVPVNLNADDEADYVNRGVDSLEKGEYDKAIAAYTDAIRLDPKYEPAYALRGIAWGKKGEYDKAIADFNEAVRLNPNNPNDYGARGMAWLEKGQYDKAIADCNDAIRLNSKDANAYGTRGFAWRKKGEYDKAIADFNQAVTINPKDAFAYNELAWLYATCPDEQHRDGKKAVENANVANRLTEGKNCGCMDTLAAAYAESGNFEKAREWETKVIKLAATDKSVTAKNRADAASRLELYKQNKPYRDEPKQKWQREAARAALIEMVKAGKHEELKMVLPHLRSDPIIADGDDCISIGKWKVSLKNRTFVILVDAGPIFAEYSGKFTQGENGTWRAEITGEKHN